MAAAVGGVPVYVRPHVDSLKRADAIFILGGADRVRYPFGLSLATAGWASTVLVSRPDEWTNSWISKQCDRPPAGITMHCFAPDPPTTKGEGRELRRLASRYGWRSVIVVTFRPHVSRARFILEQCFDGDLVMVASPSDLSLPRWAFEYAYQTAGYVRAVLQSGC